MAISYEEALATLQAMFADPWTRQTLDAVLRHEKGHMENTCELILEHGDQDPQILVDRLRAGGPEPQVAMDEQLARQLAASNTANNNSGSRENISSHKGRGTPTTLPVDFLRLPGFRPPEARPARSNTTAATSTEQPMDDETLARMLQDELFSEELARNPDFAHLAGRQQRSSRRVASSTARLPSAPAGAPLQNPFEGVNVMQKISSMSDGARRRLQLFANNFENKMKGTPSTATPGSGLQQATGAAAERRGLLDDDDDYGDDMIEFETRKSR